MSVESSKGAPFSIYGSKPYAATSGAVGQAPAHGAPAGPSLHIIFHQLTQSLSVLSSAAELVLDGRSSGEASQAVRVWLQPSARQAETALHKLREYRLIHIPATTELIQCLTVLVLAADMLIQGQLSGSGARETYELLRRNADRAMKSLQVLREHIGLNGI